jgi:DNA-packaging protein gp3
MGAPRGHSPYSGCETGGRPVIYTDEFIENEADEFKKWMQLPNSIYFKKFALNRGYHPQRLTEFASQNQKFSEVYEKAKVWQECKLVEGGLLGDYNAGFTKFVMGNTCGWAEKSQTQVSGDTANPLEFLLNRIDGTTKDLIADERE